MVVLPSVYEGRLALIVARVDVASGEKQQLEVID
jgi:hypothetical protein